MNNWMTSAHRSFLVDQSLNIEAIERWIQEHASDDQHNEIAFYVTGDKFNELHFRDNDLAEVFATTFPSLVHQQQLQIIERNKDGLGDLIKALQIIRKYGPVSSPTSCDHDELYVFPAVPPSEFSDNDKQRLEILGFIIDEDQEGFCSFRFGSC